jgi:hypothetical protein
MAIIQYDENASWMDQRLSEIDAELQQQNPFDEILLNPRLQGTYIIRMLPPESPQSIYRQIASHWNVIADDDAPKAIGCPRYNRGQPCIICEAADWAMKNAYAKKQDIWGMGNWGATKRVLMRVLLLKFSSEDKSKAVQLPELPVIRIMSVPLSVVRRLRELETSEMSLSGGNSRALIWDPVKGCPIKITKSEKIDKWWSVDLLQERWKVPERFLDVDDWPLLDDFVPNTTSEDVEAILMKFRDFIPDLVGQYLSKKDAIDLPFVRVQQAPLKSLPSSKEEEPPFPDDEGQTFKVDERKTAKVRTGGRHIYNDDDLEARMAELGA